MISILSILSKKKKPIENPLPKEYFGREAQAAVEVAAEEEEEDIDPSLLTVEERRKLDAAKLKINSIKPFRPPPERFRIIDDFEANRMNLDQQRQEMQNFVQNYKDLSSRQSLDDAEMARRRLNKQRQQMQNFGRYKWDANTLRRMKAEKQEQEEADKQEQEEGEEGDNSGGGKRKRKRKRNTKIKKTIKRKKSKRSSRRMR